MTWHPIAIPALLVLGLGVALAVFVVRARPDRSQNRRLAAVLVQGAVSTAFITGIRWLPTSELLATILLSIFMVAALLGPLIYIEFLVTLDSWLMRPFRHRIGRALLWAFSGILLVLFAAQPRLFIADVVLRTSPGGGSYWDNLPGPLFSAAAMLAIVTYLYGLLVAVSAYRGALTPILRAQAKAYAIAFGMRDAFTALNIALVVIVLGEGAPRRLQNDLGFPLIDGVFFLLLAYAILKHQLFDIDLKIKFALRQSSVAMVFAAAFFLGQEAVEAFISGSGTLYGIGTALVVAIAFRPIQAWGGRVANLVMPHVHDSPDYRAQRKRAIYAAALESAGVDGVILQEERRVLERLRDDLTIGAPEAKRMEQELFASLPRGPVATHGPKRQ